MALEEAELPYKRPGKLIEFKPKSPNFPDLYDASRAGTESFPQLARSILLVMIEQESETTKGYDRQFIRQKATDRFLEFIKQNEAMRKNLPPEAISDITRIPVTAINQLLSA